jgi:hypothetical protein
VKLTTWNAEWLDTFWGVLSGKYTPGQRIFPHSAPTGAEAQARIDAVSGFIGALDPDILFLCEAPKGEEDMLAFVASVLPAYSLVTRPSGESYETQGRQWQWFLVRKALADHITPSLIPVDTWRTFAAAQSETIGSNGKWSVASPRLQTIGGVEDVPVSSRFSHAFYREPQVLRFEYGGAKHEVIGAHLKSKFTGSSLPTRKPGQSFDAYIAAHKKVRSFLAKAHEARVKLSSEASYLRAYIDHRFSQEADPSILVVGDLNDGPGKEIMEREYLLHDLISNLQGEVFFAQRYLNHALFDQPEALRWTARFEDPIDPNRSNRILLDHILFTQALTRGGQSPLWVQSRAGRVEHLAFEEGEALYGKGMLSDHRPVSITLSDRSTG